MKWMISLLFGLQLVHALCSSRLAFGINPRRATTNRIRTTIGSKSCISSSTPEFPSSSSSSSSLSTVPSSLVTLRGGGAEVVDLAYDWCVNLGNPAALVAGAVVATLYENVRGGALEVEKGDSHYTRVAKKLTTILLLSSFALQIISIFVTTVTGTMLLSRDFSNVKITATTPLGFLRDHFEFEYLTSRISFLQGLINWLGGVALEHTIPRKGEGKAARNMDRFVASSMFTLIALLLSFYDAHLSYYKNYMHMLTRWAHVAFQRYIVNWPPRPLMALYLPGFVASIYTFTKAILPARDDESKKGD